MSSTDDAAGREERPTLPREWEQSMRKQNHPRTDESEHARAQNEKGEQRGQQAEEPSEGGTREKNERTQK
ncbi:hypothetical protein GN958_ATG18100 [Phytophthora infestans]|uniref:Uncharacterized protein n=1 Tax=Phytophthora infestans TaxID=4787 RepID=A0A8S9TVJ8_PHYIN|nr:hypothetical protein GN958_ATG18100 [Phytophthora infestans]